MRLTWDRSAAPAVVGTALGVIIAWAAYGWPCALTFLAGSFIGSLRYNAP